MVDSKRQIGLEAPPLNEQRAWSFKHYPKLLTCKCTHTEILGGPGSPRARRSVARPCVSLSAITQFVFARHVMPCGSNAGEVSSRSHELAVEDGHPFWMLGGAIA